MRLEHLMHLHGDLKAPVEPGPGPFGKRRIVDVTGGYFEGPRLKGTLLASGADWLLTEDQDITRLDVRITLGTDDGAHIYVQYPGVIVFNDTARSVLVETGETQFGDLDFFTQPRFETGHPDYAWLNSVVAVGEGRILTNAVEDNVSRVIND